MIILVGVIIKVINQRIIVSIVSLYMIYSGSVQYSSIRSWQNGFITVPLTIK